MTQAHHTHDTGCCGGAHAHSGEGCCKEAPSPAQDGCACGHAHGRDEQPTMTGPLSLLAAGSAGRMLMAGVAITGLWALTFWAMRA